MQVNVVTGFILILHLRNGNGIVTVAPMTIVSQASRIFPCMRMRVQSGRGRERKIPLPLSLSLSLSPSFSFPFSLFPSLSLSLSLSPSFPLSLSLSPSAKAGGDREVKTVNRAGLWRVGGRTLSGFGGQNTLQAAIRDSVSAVTLCVCFVCTCCPPTSVLTCNYPLITRKIPLPLPLPIFHFPSLPLSLSPSFPLFLSPSLPLQKREGIGKDTSTSPSLPSFPLFLSPSPSAKAGGDREGIPP